jgi:hypothetical protein
MYRIEWEESEPDQDGDVSITLAIISNDPHLLARARKAFRMVVDDTPKLASVPKKDEK